VARWTGPPTGIVRVQRELAAWARDHTPGVVFVFFDPTTMVFRRLTPKMADAFISGLPTLDTWGLPEATGLRARRSDWLPKPLYAAIQLRRTALRRLERLRLETQRPGVARFVDRLQRRLMNRKYRQRMVNPDGSRRDYLPASLIVREAVEFTARDILVSTGNGWGHSNIKAMARTKAATGFRLVVACYDVIPLQFPDFFKPHDVDNMRAYWGVAFEVADLVVVNSRVVERDARAYCAERGIALGRTAVCPLGADPVEMHPAGEASLPEGLEAGRYALFVSTVEPRKGHEMLYRVWLRLLAEGTPRTHGFKLVFVGRRGWMMDSLETALAEDARIAGNLLLLRGVSDATLDLLYRQAAFCLYPSLYEGYGLPVVEAFARGKAVIASSGGALSEVAGDLSPCLDPRDEDAWHDLIKQWIEDPSAREPLEAAIRERFRHPTWDEAAAAFFAAVHANLEEVSPDPRKDAEAAL
jgi:glycosyltransferase involved in cell wall biosynthesis